ncbi:hypothetical protein Golomagni_00240 [Golovinomyces magnicellulatus]|nr:hypothetical protein Golomagni_00240 [Golovinomyces magnicellulatus]
MAPALRMTRSIKEKLNIFFENKFSIATLAKAPSNIDCLFAYHPIPAPTTCFFTNQIYMEISDILNSFSTSNTGNFYSFDESNSIDSDQRVGEKDLHALVRAWVNERAITELLPFVLNRIKLTCICNTSWPQDELITRCRRRIKDRIDLIESMTGNMDPKTNFSLIIIQTDVERWKFIIRSYLRARLSKIQKFTLHYLSSPELQTYLSVDESAYAMKYQQIIHQHYLNCFLGRFPINLQNLNDSAGGINMVEVPDQEVSVFVRGLGSRNGDDAVQVKGKGKNGHGEIAVARGEVVVTKWSDVREFLKTGEMELV